MKNYMLYLVIVTVMMTGKLSAQFEGEIDMKMTSQHDGESRDAFLKMSLKQDKMAAQIKSTGETQQNAKLIFRGDQKLMWIISDEEKTYIEISLRDQKGSKKGKYSDEAKSIKKMRKSGKSQTILGYLCEEWIAEDEGEVSNIWATSRLGSLYEGVTKSFRGMGNVEGDDQMGKWSELAEKKLFPLKVTTTREGSVTESQEVTRIEAKAVSASVFQPPSGYAKQSIDMDMQKMMERMKGRKGGEKMPSGENVDVEKMMKEMQEQMQKMQTDQDSSDGDDE